MVSGRDYRNRQPNQQPEIRILLHKRRSSKQSGHPILKLTDGQGVQEHRVEHDDIGQALRLMVRFAEGYEDETILPTLSRQLS
jgi:hypothetical protein